MNVVKNLKTRVQGFCKKLTFKKKQLIIATLMIFLNCISWKKVNAHPFLGDPEIEIDNNCVDRVKKKVLGAKGKILNQWGFSSDNFFLTSDTIQKNDEGLDMETENVFPYWPIEKSSLWNNGLEAPVVNVSCQNETLDEELMVTEYTYFNPVNPIFFPDLVEEVNESEKLRKKTNKVNFGGMLLSGLKVFGSKYSFFSETILKPKFSGALESLELAAMSNPELQSFSSCLLIYPEIKTFLGLDNFINEDPGKGFVVGKISSGSGSDLSREVIIQQKIFGYHTTKNLKNAFHYQKKISSSLFRKKDIDCIDRNKTQNLEEWTYFHNKKDPKLSFLDISSGIKEAFKKKKKKTLLFPNKKLDQLESLDQTFNHNSSFKINNEKASSKKIQQARNFNLFGNSDLIEDIDYKKRRFRRNLNKKPKFSKNKMDITDTLVSSIEETLEDDHLSFCDEFYLTGTEIELNWNIGKRVTPFYLHNLRKTIKKFIVSNISKNFGYTRCLCIPSKNKKKSYNIIIKEVDFYHRNYLGDKNLKNFQKNLFDEILKSKKFLFKEEESEEDSDVSHLKESFKLSDPLGMEFLGKIFSIGSDLPKSSSESNKFFYQASFMGNLDAQHFLGLSLLEGKGISRKKNISRSIMISSAKLSHMDSIYDSSLLIGNGVGGGADIIRAFYLNKQLTEFGGGENQISRLISTKERVGLSKIFFPSISADGLGFLNCFVGSLFFNSMSFFSVGILEKMNKISSALNYQHKAVFENGFNPLLSAIELFLENRQTFLSIEKSKLSNGFFSKLKTLKGSTSIQRSSISIYTILKLRALRPNFLEFNLFFFSIFRAILSGVFYSRIAFYRLNRLMTEIITGKKKNIRFFRFSVNIFLTLRVIFF